RRRRPRVPGVAPGGAAVPAAGEIFAGTERRRPVGSGVPRVRVPATERVRLLLTEVIGDRRSGRAPPSVRGKREAACGAGSVRPESRRLRARTIGSAKLRG